MSWAHVHRWLAIVLVVLLAVWSVTGLVFHLKPGWDRAYDQLSAERRGPALRVDAIVSLGSIRASLGEQSITRLELFDTALGSLYRVNHRRGFDEQVRSSCGGTQRWCSPPGWSMEILPVEVFAADQATTCGVRTVVRWVSTFTRESSVRMLIDA